LGEAYNLNGEHNEGSNYFIKANEIYKLMNDKRGIVITSTKLASLFYYQNKYGNSVSFIEAALTLIDSIEDVRWKSISSLIGSIVYEGIGKNKEALKCLKNHTNFQNQFDNIDTKLNFFKTELNTEFQKQKRVNEQKHLAELTNKRNQQVALVFGFCFVLIVSIVFYNRFRITRKQKGIIEEQKKLVYRQKLLVEEKQKEILDSINYAKKIQFTLLAHTDLLQVNIPNHFVYFNPKDIVSGDFYWATNRDEKFYLGVCDSTGHGVPGAFMSLLSISFLNEAISEKGIEKPNEILNFVRQRLIENISKEGQRDGFDGILLCIDKRTNEITYAAANNAPLLVKESKYFELEFDRMPVGMGQKNEGFRIRSINYNQGDILYMYTDGFADQFGGPKGKKFKRKQLNDLLLSLSSTPIGNQKENLKEVFVQWKGDLEQIDDICIIGIRL